MEEVKKFNPMVRKAPNGKYKISCTIKPSGESKLKIVMGEILNLTEVKLMFPKKLDNAWNPIEYKGRTWYFKIDKVNNVQFFNH